MKLNGILCVLALSGLAGLWAPPQSAFAQQSKDVRRVTMP